MYSFQGQIYNRLEEVPTAELDAFLHFPALTETINIQDNQLLFWEEHYLRLMASMRILRMPIPLRFTLEYLQEKMMELVATSSHNFTGRISIRVVKSTRATKVLPLVPSLFSLELTTTEELFSYRTMSSPIDLYKDHYLPMGLYSSLESVHQVWREMAWVFVYENNYSDGILLNEQKRVIETLRGSLFLIKGNEIQTPPITEGCRKNIYRSLMLEILSKSSDFEFIETPISTFALQKADELFVLEGVESINSIIQYRKKSFVTEKTEKIVSLLEQRIREHI